MIEPKIDSAGRTVRISANGLLRVDEIAVARVVRRPDGVYLQLRDSNRARSITRGTEFVEVRLDALVNRLNS